MSEDITETLGKLQTEDPSLALMRERIVLCSSQHNANSMELRAVKDELLQRYRLPSCEKFHNQAFYAVLIGMAYFFLQEKQEAVNWFETGICQFRNLGEVWNQCITLKIQGFAFQSDSEPYQAICAFEEAQHLLMQEIHIHENDYALDFQGLITNLDDLVRNARLSPTRNKPFRKPVSRTSPKVSQANQAWQSARIIYSIRDFGHANQNPKYDMNDDQISEMSIDAISFDGVSHTVYNLRRGAGSQIKLTSSGNYRWLKVAGTSMNRASPISIEPGDYVLADLDQEPQINNIVIASLHNPPTPEEKAGVIKRYTSKGLKSESIKQIDLIPLAEADIRGTVIAVAKTSKAPTYPLSPEEEELYQSLLAMVSGDKSVAERLISFEQDCGPEENREQYLKNAILKLKRERQST